MLGVAILIIVMSVMNGFREELVGSLTGINGDITIYNVEEDRIISLKNKYSDLRIANKICYCCAIGSLILKKVFILFKPNPFAASTIPLLIV